MVTILNLFRLLFVPFFELGAFEQSNPPDLEGSSKRSKHEHGKVVKHAF